MSSFHDWLELPTEVVCRVEDTGVVRTVHKKSLWIFIQSHILQLAQSFAFPPKKKNKKNIEANYISELRKKCMNNSAEATWNQPLRRRVLC